VSPLVALAVLTVSAPAAPARAPGTAKAVPYEDAAGGSYLAALAGSSYVGRRFSGAERIAGGHLWKFEVPDGRWELGTRGTRD